MSRQELFVNSEVPPDDDPWEINPDRSPMIEWGEAVVVAFSIVSVFVLVVILGGCLFFASMVMQWP